MCMSVCLWVIWTVCLHIAASGLAWLTSILQVTHCGLLALFASNLCHFFHCRRPRRHRFAIVVQLLCRFSMLYAIADYLSVQCTVTNKASHKWPYESLWSDFLFQCSCDGSVFVFLFLFWFSCGIVLHTQIYYHCVFIIIDYAGVCVHAHLQVFVLFRQIKARKGHEQ